MMEAGPSAPQQEESKSSFNAFGGRGVSLGTDLEQGRRPPRSTGLGSGAVASPVVPGQAPVATGGGFGERKELTAEAKRNREAQARALKEARDRMKAGNNDEEEEKDHEYEYDHV